MKHIKLFEEFINEDGKYTSVPTIKLIEIALKLASELTGDASILALNDETFTKYKRNHKLLRKYAFKANSPAATSIAYDAINAKLMTGGYPEDVYKHSALISIERAIKENPSLAAIADAMI